MARVHVDPLDGLSPDAAADLVARAGIEGSAAGLIASILPPLYQAYVSADADLVEINPLVMTASGDLVALDAKVTLDDSAAFRHPEWQVWRATEELDPRERRAREKGLNYVGLDGTVGIIGNGAGLVMSTLDVVSHVGGSAANFLDVGGGASAAVIAAALEVVSSDEKVGRHPRQHLRRDHAGRRGGQGHHPGGVGGRHPQPHRRQARRHQRRGGQGAAGRPPVGPAALRADHARRRPAGCRLGRAGRGGGQQ